MCAWLEVSRSGYYAWRGAGPSQRSEDDIRAYRGDEKGA